MKIITDMQNQLQNKLIFDIDLQNKQVLRVPKATTYIVFFFLKITPLCDGIIGILNV
jgi:hypothetical protein